MDYLSNGSNNVLELGKLRNELTNALISGATVSATVYQSDGTTAVSGASNLSLAAVSGRPGLYRGVVASTVTLPAGTVLIKYTAVDSGVTRVFWREAIVLDATNPAS